MADKFPITPKSHRFADDLGYITKAGKSAPKRKSTIGNIPNILGNAIARRRRGM